MEKGLLFGAGFGLCLSALLPVAPVKAQYQVFQPYWEEAAWQVERRPQACVLQQTIAQFGPVRFEQRPGRPLALSLSARLNAGRLGQVRVISQPPPWKHGVAARPLGEFALSAGASPVTLPAAQSRRVYHELESGMQTRVEFVPGDRPVAAAGVVLSPLRFLQVLPEFVACTRSLPQLDFAVLDSENVYFARNSFHLDATARRTLEQVVRRWRKQKDFRVVLGGYADASGHAAYNLRLSRRRAESAARYLRWRGLPKAAIEMRHFGASRADDATRAVGTAAHSRRVTVWLAAR